MVFTTLHAGWPKGNTEIEVIEDALREYLPASGWVTAPPSEGWTTWWWSPHEQAEFELAIALAPWE